MQSKKMSMIESVTNMVAGIILALITQKLVFGWYGIQVSNEVNLQLTACFTLVSLVRSYAVRRIFNNLAKRV